MLPSNLRTRRRYVGSMDRHNGTLAHPPTRPRLDTRKCHVGPVTTAQFADAEQHMPGCQARRSGVGNLVVRSAATREIAAPVHRTVLRPLRTRSAPRMAPATDEK